MDITLVGGTFDDNNWKQSGCVNTLADNLSSVGYRVSLYNGGLLADLPRCNNSPLTIWMPDIANETPKEYPQKPLGGILICSKVMREGYNRIDAVSRIFQMHGNAVIAIYKGGTYNSRFKFELIDALNNVWYSGYDLRQLQLNITYFVSFTKNALRVPSKKASFIDKVKLRYLSTFKGAALNNPLHLLDINNTLAKKITTSCGQRFFGNVSTRCQSLFPSMRLSKQPVILVSPRNSNKAFLTLDSMVPAILKESSFNEGCHVVYLGNKPSVDTAVQLKLYKQFPNINYMIHGHAEVINCSATTNHYRLCGDLREYEEIAPLISNLDTSKGIINLKHHGFLIYADTLENLDVLAKQHTFNIVASSPAEFYKKDLY